MVTIGRRMALGAGLALGGTVAAALILRKPQAQVIATPLAAHPVALQSLDGLVMTEPPVAPASAVLVDADGAEHGLGSFAGKGLVVNLWATWCVPCVAEMPALQALARAVADAGILVLPLSSDRGGAAVVAKFYAAHSITGLPVWLDPKGAAASAWGARGLPTTLLVDRQGRERARFEGAADWASAASVAAIRRLLG